MSKKLYRSSRQRMVAGVCGGLAEYFQVDVTIIRLLWILAAFFSLFGPALLLYFIGAIIIPVGSPFDDSFEHNASNTTTNAVLLIGCALIVIGALSLFNQFFPLRHIWNTVRHIGLPILLIAVGVITMATAFRRR